MANIKVSAAGRDAALDALGALLSGGTLNIYTGSKPATPETSATGTLLATLTLGAPAFGTSAAGATTATTITNEAILATGTAGYCRLADSSGNGVVDGNVDVVSSGAFVEVSSTSFVMGVTLSATSLVLNLPIGS